MKNKYIVTHPLPNEFYIDPKSIFVFGSNEAGIHGAGAALYALKELGAKRGIGFGIQGKTFALPTKNTQIQTLPLLKIEKYVNEFKKIALDYKDYNFWVSRVGCGLAGYNDLDIAPMFLNCGQNIFLPVEWERIHKEILEKRN